MHRRAAGVLAALALGVGGCGALEGSRPPASVPLTQAAPADNAATPAAPLATDGGVAPAAGFLPGDALRVAAAKVTVFDDASEASAVVGEAAHDDVVIISGVPKVDAAGSIWLYVYAANSPVRGRLPELPAPLPYPEFVLTGWIRAGDEQGARVARIPPRCPVKVDLAMVSVMLGSEQLACFGNRSLTFEGSSGCGPCGGGDICEPAWLACNAGGSLINPNGETPGLALYLPPPLAPPDQGRQIQVRGHFDDPRATTCDWLNDADDTPQPIVAELCRRHFVVEAIVVLPTPPPNPLE